MTWLVSFFKSDWHGVPPIINIHTILSRRRFGLGVVFTRAIGGWFNAWHDNLGQKEMSSQPYHLVITLLWLQVDIMINITTSLK